MRSWSSIRNNTLYVKVRGLLKKLGQPFDVTFDAPEAVKAEDGLVLYYEWHCPFGHSVTKILPVGKLVGRCGECHEWAELQLDDPEYEPKTSRRVKR